MKNIKIVRSLYQAYKKPSAEKIRIYEEIKRYLYKSEFFYDMRVYGNTFSFSVYVMHKETSLKITPNYIYYANPKDGNKKHKILYRRYTDGFSVHIEVYEKLTNYGIWTDLDLFLLTL